MRSVHFPRWHAAAAALVVMVAVAACSAGDGADDLYPALKSNVSSSAPPTPAPTTQPAQCDDPLASIAPASNALTNTPNPLAIPPSSSMARIRDRGSLVVGVAADTVLLGSRNSFTGQIEGFDIDILREVSQAIFGDPNRLQFRVISAADRIPVLTSGEVDLVARAFTINCERWQQVAFSAPYFTAGQRVLVAEGSPATGLDSLGGAKVCAPRGTTTLTRLEEYPSVEAVAAPTHGQCLALFQQGQVDAITGDDTILAGFAAQDPYATIVGEKISAEPYGIGVSAQNRDLVQFVNAVLEQSIADGSWAQIYDRWFAPHLGAAPPPPTPVYGR